jgi:hypothetical protein
MESVEHGVRWIRLVGNIAGGLQALDSVENIFSSSVYSSPGSVDVAMGVEQQGELVTSCLCCWNIQESLLLML